MIARFVSSLVFAAVLVTAPMAHAENGAPAGGYDLIFELGTGPLVAPKWEGSDDYVFSPWPIVSLEYLSVFGFTIGGGPERAFSIRPDFAYRDGRDDSDDSALNNLGDVDAAVELGLAASYRYQFLRGNLAVRHGFGGHHGVVGEASVEVLVDPTDRWSFAVGPEVTFASNDYMDRYFGVSAAQAARTALARHEADGGFKSVGVIASSRYGLTENLFLNGQASWHRLIGDAADSPIVDRAGSDDQFTAGVGLSYRFRINFFD